MTIETYPAMNAEIVEILRWDKSNSMLLYAAQRIEELEAEAEQLRGSLEEILDEATSDFDRDIIITECQLALAEPAPDAQPCGHPRSAARGDVMQQYSACEER